MGTHPIFESDFDCLTGETIKNTKMSDPVEDIVSQTRRPRPPPLHPQPPPPALNLNQSESDIFWPNPLKALPIINKDIFRNMVWDTLDSANLVRFPRPCKGRIPNFHGHNRAANRLSKTKEYVEARTVKVNSSLAQEKVRY